MSTVAPSLASAASSRDQLAWALHQYCLLRGRVLDKRQLSSALPELDAVCETWVDASRLCRAAELPALRVLPEPDIARLPLLAYVAGLGWGVVVQAAAGQQWLMRTLAGEVTVTTQTLAASVGEIDWPAIPEQAHDTTHGAGKALPSFAATLKEALRGRKSPLLDAIMASLLINVVSLAVSMYSMQVYDRVIPTHGYSTLLVLAGGVLLALFFDLGMKLARSSVMESLVGTVDSQLSRHIFQRLLAVRIDQLPGSVGSLAGQIRGYEQIRAFYTSSTLFALVDLPMGLLFIAVILVIGGPFVALVPVIFLIVSVIVGIVFRKRFNALALSGADASNKKTGLLVEAVEGADTIKAGAGGWKFLQRWMQVTTSAIQNDLKLRGNSEGLSYATGLFNQLCYVGIVSVGAWQAIEGNMTMGGLIACSILGGRVLTPVASIPTLIVQHAHAKAASLGLERLFALETDHHGVDRPLVPSAIEGHLKLENIKFAYAGQKDAPIALDIAQLDIKAGERVGILGPIGSGKSTLLRVLSGLYKPQQGRVLLDNLDISHIDRHIVSEKVGYLQQDTRLFQGTLRENLLIGLADPGDDALFKVLQRTGLIRFVSSHPRGLALPIMEGGRGLSGGQRQLVAFTRLLLTQPKVWLLDEPTASMDDDLERHCLNVLSEELTADRTLVVVTHKVSLLPMVKRLIVVVGNRILLDSTRDDVLARLSGRNQAVSEGDPSNAPSEKN